MISGMVSLPPINPVPSWYWDEETIPEWDEEFSAPYPPEDYAS